MGSIVNATSSSSAVGRVSHHTTADSAPGRLLSSVPTSVSRPGPINVRARSLDAPPPLPKRRRLDGPPASVQNPPAWAYDNVFVDCLKRQVFPHVDRPLASLPKGQYKNIDIGKEVIANLIGPQTEFTNEYKRGNGFISDAFERQLAERAVKEIQNLIRRPEYRRDLPIPSTQVPHPISSRPCAAETPVPPPSVPIPPRTRAVETPVPPPSLPIPPKPRVVETPVPQAPLPSRPRAVQTPVPPPQVGAQIPLPVVIPPAARAPPPVAPRHSFSPIPLPILGRLTISPSTQPNSLGPARTSSSLSRQPQIIVIEDDEDEDGSVEPERARTVSGAPSVREASLREVSLGEANPRVPTPGIEAALPASVHAAPSPIPHPVVIQPPLRPSSPRRFLPWRAGGSVESKWLSEERHPYISADDRERVRSGAEKLCEPDNAEKSFTFHVDFSIAEIEKLRIMTRKVFNLREKKADDPSKELRKLIRKNSTFLEKVLRHIDKRNPLPKRTVSDVTNFFRDLRQKTASKTPTLLAVEKVDSGRQEAFSRSGRVYSLLFTREVTGHHGYRSVRRLVNFPDEFRRCREDGMQVRAEWTDCAGDIATIAWVSSDAFICGTTEHSDSHNQQYNKPGNLVLGSYALGSVQAYPQHRIVRPIVDKGDNSTDAMRQSQDPWLYSSVVSSDYDAVHDRAFTSGFDRTVKVWKVDKSGSFMSVLGDWRHRGNVNFVAASKHASGMVATASDVASDAIRIYNIDDQNISGSPYRSYSCSRVTDAQGNTVSTEKWTYFPATMQWGITDGVKHLLLVGYSPRSRTDFDGDIPADRLHTGELCMWDGLTGERWRITSATTQNVFEVVWHPHQESFIAATSPLGIEVEPGVRTQIRIFRMADSMEYGGKAFTPVKTLDCTAADINELTFMPNSFSYCYITAGCTDGKVYVWDTALGDKPIRVLEHGRSVEELSGDRESEDVGVKFTAWGTTLDRFYTGSSDGVVKVWNIRSNKRQPLVRNLLEVPAPVSCGMFSPDRTRLLIGDASGRIFLLSVDDEDEEKHQSSTITVKLPGAMGVKKIRRPTPIVQHLEPPPPTVNANHQPHVVETGVALAQLYLGNGQLVLHKNPTIGAVQGPQYLSTGLFKVDAHLDGNPQQPLLAEWQSRQQDAVRGSTNWKPRFAQLRSIKEHNALEICHLRNVNVDLDASKLDWETYQELVTEGVDFNVAEEYPFVYEEELESDEEF
ncbi:hypothetical protein B0H67DRAFT_545687 [Lasiosphaeris hirsuta]|uniref:Rik1-associated factor 1 n=1 Tax=Lasiosphaeris hirsuta TaxID=260670 RepID=A0AA39ZWK7_9PEZI|nr:hypothetical protein B0H67DRAFT_545687 [Lasiosphaeris hirsuta]